MFGFLQIKHDPCVEILWLISTPALRGGASPFATEGVTGVAGDVVFADVAGVAGVFGGAGMLVDGGVTNVAARLPPYRGSATDIKEHLQDEQSRDNHKRDIPFSALTIGIRS